MGKPEMRKSTGLVTRPLTSGQVQNAVKAGERASKTIDRHLIHKWKSVVEVKRHVIVWLLIVAIILGGLFMQNRQLSLYYREPKFVDGGSYSEGIIGDFTNLNPIFSTGLVDSSASRLLFGSLLKYDTNNRLVGDLADSVTPDDRGVTYTAKLKPNLTWHDGKPLTSADVVFTFKSIQHPDTRSPLNPSWQLIKIEAPDPQTIVFTLPVALSSFPQSLTTGIIPQHILGEVQPSQLRSHPFNTKGAIGSGPFKLNAVTILSLDSKEIVTEPFDDYYAGKPKLDRFVLRTYVDQEGMQKGFKAGEIQAMAGGTFLRRTELNQATTITNFVPQANGVFAFFRVSQPPLNDKPLREALINGYDRGKLLAETLGFSRLPLDGPLLQLQLPYSKDLRQYPFDPAKADQVLTAAGWVKNQDGVRIKDGKPLVVNLVTQNTDEYSMVATDMQSQWQKIGIKVNVSLVGEQELQQNHITPHNYDILLYSVNLGVDPDVYAYWHSREAGLGGFNLSEYKNSAVDTSLEGGRTRSDGTQRSIKYQGFLQAWQRDIPAMALYQSSFDYVRSAATDGFTPHTLVSPADRFNEVHNWRVLQRIQDK